MRHLRCDGDSMTKRLNAALRKGGEVTDLEITKLCAEAMGYKFTRLNPYELSGILVNGIVDEESRYDPIHDDAQAMALVKKFHVAIGWNADQTPTWGAFRQDTKKWCVSLYLNRAICECVAKMQQAKGREG